MKSLHRLVALCLLAFSLSAFSYTVPQGSPGFYHGNSSAAVTFDAHSLFLDNKRLYVFSGEVHPWRIPSGKAAWRDVFQKMKAAGFNSVSVYHHWGLSEGKQGSLDFNFFRSHTDVYEVAKEVGILVVPRPGPYINAETTAGGFPGWLTNNPAKARTNATGFTQAWTPFMTSVAKFAAPFQYPDGPVIAVQSENEFFPSSGSDTGRSEYMQAIENTLRGNGITKVPLTHNDANTGGRFVKGLGGVDLYMWDSYPQGFDCANPTSWSEVNSNYEPNAHQQYIPDEMWASGEFQGGSFDPWGGSGYDKCFQLTNEQFANVLYKNNYAAQTSYQNLYMTYGGTNWGNLAEPTVYTSYDYGAPIREDRTLSPKYSEIKLQATFLHSSPDFLIATSSTNGTSITTNSGIYASVLQSPTGVGFYILRQNSVKTLTSAQFQLRVNTSQGQLTVPQFGGSATLDGRESQILVSEYPFGSHKLQYSTAEIFAWSTIGGVDNIILYAQAGHSIEVVVSNVAAGSTAKVSGSTSINARTGNNNTVIITGSPSGISSVSISSKATVIVADKHTALSFWNIQLPSTTSTIYDKAPDVPSVFIFGPYLVRNATITGSRLAINGDTNVTSTTIDIIAPPQVNSVTWNGSPIRVTKSNIGTLRGTIITSLQPITLPNLKDASQWSCLDSLPEIQSNFDDSSWVTANKTATQRPIQPSAGKFVLYADEYGFHQGNTIARGHFTGNTATGVQLNVQGGFNFGYSVWVNDQFLGSNQGTNQYSSGGGTDQTTDTWTFNQTSLNTGDNVVTVVVDTTGLEEDYSGNDQFKTPRGIRGYKLIGGGDFDHWKIQGNLGGEDFPDKVRGPLNEGGLFVERQGGHLPGAPPTLFNQSSCTPLNGITSAGIRAYKTSFNLDIPTNVDAPVALQFTRTPSSSYRSVIYINGWQFGRFNSKDGPQTVFPLPEGILNHRGSNDLVVTLWSLDANGATIADLELVTTGIISSSKEAVAQVQSPSFSDLRL
ncbi:glycoside hydrolase superfamily [Abortiporus biennis]|nr:glycoside hydrolase superfamily [Abortiporus biennis]